MKKFIVALAFCMVSFFATAAVSAPVANDVTTVTENTVVVEDATVTTPEIVAEDGVIIVFVGPVVVIVIF